VVLLCEKDDAEQAVLVFIRGDGEIANGLAIVGTPPWRRGQADDAVHGGLQTATRGHLQELADVDDEGAGLGRASIQPSVIST